jgi:hypothetical protein
VPTKTHLTRSTRWISRVLGSLAVVAVMVILSACQAAPPVPTPPCVEPTLTLGTTKFVIKTIARAADGSIAVPSDTPGIAYQVEGTQPNYVLALSPTATNAALKEAIKDGDKATIIQANCNSTTFSVSAPQPAPSNVATLLTQPASGLVLLVQASPSAAGFVVTGELSEEILKAIDTPQPGPSNRQAEVSLLDTSTSADKATIRVGVSILNSGTAPFTLAASDVSLTPENGAPTAPSSAEPSLPHDFQPGKTETIYFTFPRPSSNQAAIKIIDAEFDLENF